MIVVVDPGHGGPETDGAAIGDVREDALALEVATELELSLRGLPVEVVLTRNADTPLSLDQRGEIAKAANADLVVSVHLNVHELPSVHGLNLFHLPGDQTATRIADHIARVAPPPVFTGVGRIYATRPLPDWTGRAHNVLSAHRRLHEAPVLLVECCYLSHAADRAYVQSRWGRAQIVSAIRSGICRAGELLAPVC